MWPAAEACLPEPGSKRAAASVHFMPFQRQQVATTGKRNLPQSLAEILTRAPTEPSVWQAIECLPRSQVSKGLVTKLTLSWETSLPVLVEGGGGPVDHRGHFNSLSILHQHSGCPPAKAGDGLCRYTDSPPTFCIHPEGSTLPSKWPGLWARVLVCSS